MKKNKIESDFERIVLCNEYDLFKKYFQLIFEIFKMSKSDLPTSSKDSFDGNELDPERVRFTTK